MGIGTVSPSYKLDVAGDVRSTGSSYAAAHVTTSDKRLKTEIVKLNGSLDKVTKLNGYGFSWKSDGRRDV